MLLQALLQPALRLRMRESDVRSSNVPSFPGFKRMFDRTSAATDKHACYEGQHLQH